MMRIDITHQVTASHLKLPRLLSDNMVLQRDTSTRIWGWAKPGKTVTIRFLGRTYSTRAASDGKWTARLPMLKTGGPYSMEIKADDDVITIKNILIGDVWICSGQSNMVLPMSRVKDLYADEITHSENPAIRQFLVPERYDYRIPHQDLESGSWKPANPGNVLDFSATGYFFARDLWEKYHIPVGLINASRGGAPVEAFLSKGALKAFPASLALAEKFMDTGYLNRMINNIQTTHDNWYEHVNKLDQGVNNSKKPWFDPGYDALSWPVMRLPAFWDDEGLTDVHGVVWFRKEVVIPHSMTGRQARLLLGRIVDDDTVYINGTVVGTTGYQYPPRIYDIPLNLLTPGKNTIVVRVINTTGRGGFIKDKPYYLEAGDTKIDLKGEWQYRVGAVTEELPDLIMIECQPLGSYNGMIAPLINYSIKGVIWYQGESNIGKAGEYRRLFPALIADWRSKWGHEDFPFLYAQLANYMPAQPRPSKSEWAELRDAQLGALSIPNTGMAVTIDCGEWNDIHPLNKKDVGERLALAAQKVAYGDDKVVYSGPLYRSMKIEGNRIILTFSNTGSGLISRGGDELKGFAIAGTGGRGVECFTGNSFVWAKAEILGNNVIVWNDQVADPIAVRYAWADNPEGANLYNKEGLPASPFTTETQH